MGLMRRILCTYSKRNPLIGYCQGMNFILARILKYTQCETEAFWIFTHLLEDVLPNDYYT